MKQKTNILRGRPWLMLLALLAWLVPQQAVADTYDTYVDKSYNYSVSLDGANTVKIHVPVYVQEGYDCWIKDGKLKVSIGGGSEITLFRWQATENISGSADNCWTTFSTEAGGHIQVTLGNTSSSVKVTSGGSVNGNVIQNNDDAETYDVTALWYVPYNVLGKKLTFKWDVERNGNSRSDAKLTLPAPDAITMPSAGQTLQPIISDAMLSTGSKGQIEVPWYLASTTLNWIYYEYTDANKNVVKVDMDKNVNHGVIRLNATEPHDNFHIVASYKMKGEGDSSYDIEPVVSSSDNLTMIHPPVGLSATAIDGVNPKVELRWIVPYVDFDDFSLTDFFEVQRSLTGKEEDFETIGQEVFTQASKKSEYVFVDSTIVQSIKKNMLVNGGTLEKVTYRVRRAMSQIWGWDAENNCATSASTVVDNLHLLRIAKWSAKWEDERAYTVRVSWDYADEYNGVWDDRAKMILHLTSKNNDGKIVEDRTIELNQEERTQRYKVLNLSRSCVHYDIDMYVEQDKSPLGYVITSSGNDDYFAIKSADDWVTFRDKVQGAKGQYDVNARLYADINTNISIGWESDRPYRGTFDGNGHTVNFNISNSGEYIALFRYAKDYTIKNLHLTGSVKGARHSAGLVGNSTATNGKSNVITNCRVSVAVDCTSDHAGGIIGHGFESGHYISNSLFDGSVKCGSGTTWAGAFIGWQDNASLNKITNCVENGSYSSVTHAGFCYVHAGGGNGSAWGNKGSSTNNWTYKTSNWDEVSYVGSMSTGELLGKLGSSGWVTDNGKVAPKTTTIVAITDYFMPIRTYDDWVSFRDKVQAANGQYDVNARLYADVNAGSIMVGWEQTYAYRGTFDGNGHTLTFNVPDHNRDNLAPFIWVGNATIKNLHTAGTITSSKKCIGGLISQVLPNAKATVENCRSSVTLNSSVDGDATNGGFVGVINSNATVTFRNSKFDGSFEGDKCHHNGGFIGYNNGSVTIDNCLFAPERISTKSDGCQTWARIGTGSLNVINSHATREYTTYIVIRNASDWNTFRDLVKAAKGQYWVDARLEADITVQGKDKIVGYSGEYPYRGTFDGNGHTITLDISDDAARTGLFSHASNATFRNLNLKGTISASEMWEGSLIGQIDEASSVLIENCRSSVTVKNSRDGDATMGGFVGNITATNSSLTFRNCRFDGSLEGDKCHSNAGFVGWTNSKVTIDNCLFTPHHLSTRTDNCEIWTRNSSGNLTLINSEAYPGGYGAKYISIRNDKDWEMFRDMVTASAGKYWIDARLEADITTGYGIGLNTDTPYRGTFIGDGHTLTVDISRSDDKACGLFCYVGDASIRDLHLKGKITGNNHVGGLIGMCDGYSTVTIDRVWVSTEAKTSYAYGGGVIGHSNLSTINMNDCLYDGKVITNNANPNSFAGQIIGWCNGGSWKLQRVYDHGALSTAHYRFFCIDYNWNTYNWSSWGTNSSSYTITQYGWGDVDQHDKTDQNEVVNLMNGRQAGSWKIVDGLAVPNINSIDLNVGEQNWVNKFGSDNWQLVDGKAVPKMESAVISEASLDDLLAKLGNNWVKEGETINPVTTKVDEPKYDPITKPTLPDFYHTSNGKIEKTLITETRQSSVLLTWDTDGNPIDFFTVLRREVGQTDADWKEVATDIDQMSYEDKTVSPVITYEYKVRATNNCEGVSYSETDVKRGSCRNTGRVDGYVRFNDGTGAYNVKVAVIDQETGKETKTVTTDASGYFVADGLPYKDGGASTTYRVQALDIQTKEGEDASTVTFNSKSNDQTLNDFIIINGKRFSGLVWFEGTSIPVKGARFKVNGMDVYNGAGKCVETEYDGSFSFRIRSGQNTIQVYMDGHEFTNDGYFKSQQGYDFKGDETSVLFYDATKVKLTGRVVGGNVQGKLPLGNNLSTNNLGDSIKMVLTLEGDNGSWLVYDTTNENKSERETTYNHSGSKGHKTYVKTTRKRMEVMPDQATGEYMLMLPPVRWKLQQVYCKGYPTLFQEDQVSEVIDLTDCLAAKDSTVVGTFKDVDGSEVKDPKVTYNAIYNRIYRSPIELTYMQMGFDNFDYFGDKQYTATNMAGERAVVPLAYKGADGRTAYTFGYPVFSLERKYYIQVQVAESYRYNNDPTVERLDIVPVGGGIATMQNAMKAGQAKETKELDDQGQAIFELGVDQTTQLLSGENALKTVTFTAEQDGSIYEAVPLNGFVLNMFPLGEGVDIMTSGQPLLFDVLRDPPGSRSSATLSEGSTFNYSYKMDMKTSAGVKFTSVTGDKTNSYVGTVSAPMGAGTASGDIFTADNGDATASEFVFDMTGNKAYSYTMTTHNDITTSNEPTMVGADADLYIGLVQNIQVMPMSTIRALPDEMYQHMVARLGQTTGEGPTGLMGMFSTYGSLIHIAEGYDGQGNKFHLVRDESLAYGPKLESQFIYSQKKILTQVIPQLAKEVLELMYVGTQSEAQALANSTKQPVYLSLRDPQDPLFGVANALYNTTVTVPNDSTNYLIVLPTNTEQIFPDEVSEKNTLIAGWTMMIAQNEYEKLTADDLVANYDVSGAQAVSYSESFETNYSNAMMLHFPFSKDPQFFEADEDKDASEQLGEQIIEAILKALETVEEEEPGAKMDPEKEEEEPTGAKAEIGFGGTKFKWKLTPVLTSECLGTYGSGKAYSRKESFTIMPDKHSSLNVDVYRVALPDLGNDEKEEEEEFEIIPDDPSSKMNDNSDYATIFMSDKFKKEQKHILAQLEQEVMQTIAGPQGFVYRTRGGATANPWEDQRTTKVYNAGLVLDQRTLKINNPTIRLDKQSVSGVSIGDAARFKVYLANESEKPEAVSTIDYFTLFVDNMSNPNGAKIYVDGEPLSSNGTNITLIPGMVTEKTLEVRAGVGFDFEGLRLGIESPTDPHHIREFVSFDVHFLREAGAVNISMPSDKWVINTNAQMDSKRGWYIPVTINGFDRYQHNFDHIEFQYKETQKGEDNWTNLCSYYADSLLMANANGVREMIPENGNIVTQFFGEDWVIEKAYDLRAVVYCRNGNSYLTTSSRIISGVKDTRRPQLFGTPEPKSGLLTYGDDIVFNFSEDIEYNYLRAVTNFEVKGEVNNNEISETVSIQFTDKASVESEAKRNFGGKDLTIDLMVKPTETGREMPLFSHGTNGQKLQLWLTQDFKLKAVIDDQVFTSTNTVKKGVFTQVALILNQTDHTLTFINDDNNLGTFTLNAQYNGTGALIFGRTNEVDRSQSQFYEGRMMEARLWYRAMDIGLLTTTYGKRRLTGYEKDLVDYYPMNEGSGDYAADLTQGANAKLVGANWAIPQGMSLHLEKADKGLELAQSALDRTSEQDYTLMFWFKTDAEGRGTLISNGRGLKEDDGALHQFHIGFEAEKLMYRSNGFAIEVPGDWSDNQWHHYAMTVNRARNVANIYVDKELRTTFGADSLGGISGGTPLIGASRYVLANDASKKETDGETPLKGNIDELAFFAQALPQSLISTFATKSPNGDEAGLKTYLGFDRQERQKDNTIEMVPYVYSKVIEKDQNGNILYELDPETQKPSQTPVRKYEFNVDQQIVLNHIDATMAAPVLPYEELKNLNYAFIGKGNQIMVELDEPAAKLNHRNIYVTVREVEDKYGNTLASPQTACFLVVNSRLEWLLNRLDYTIKYGVGEDVELPFYNNSASAHTYTIENCPSWITLDKYTDVVAPQFLESVSGKISKDLNVGTYNEIIYLTDEEGITEPFYFNLTVEDNQPEWSKSISSDLLKNSMNISGQVYLNGDLDSDSRDIVGAFDSDNVCHGFANISHNALTGETGLYLTVYDKVDSGSKLNFRLWQYNTGRELVLTPDQTISFKKSAVVGDKSPVRFNGGDSIVQNVNLKKGWNWISFNVSSPLLKNATQLLNSMPLKHVQIVTDLGSDLTLSYRNKMWMVEGGKDNITFSPKQAYGIKVDEDCSFIVAGAPLKKTEDITINLSQGWNGIGYTPMVNLTVETALSDYYDLAEPGDVIKSHTEFAIFTKTGNTGRWRGSLQYMKPGEGYMMKSLKSSASFSYPYLETGGSFFDGKATTRGGSRAMTRGGRTSMEGLGQSTMCVCAVVEGFELQDGDRLLAYANGECCGEAAYMQPADDEEAEEPFYLSISGDHQAPLRFAIERGGEMVAATAAVMDFRPNAVVGSPDEPIAINFSGDPTGIRITELTNGTNDELYDLSGRKVTSRQSSDRKLRKGVYIHHGEKVVIK